MLMRVDPRVRLAEAMREMAYRARRNALSRYRPYAKQCAFHAAGAVHRERLFSAGNQLGKTFSGAAETAMHLTGRYPAWWEGKVFEKATSGWAASVTAEVTRDAIQRLLLGRPGIDADLGTAAIPADAIVETRPRSGVANAVSQIIVRHGGGGDVQAGHSMLGLKSYDQGREKFQAETLDFVWLDEEPPYDIYTEALTRTNTTMGPVYLTFTPLQGMSQTVMRFVVDKHFGTVVIYMGIYDAGHYTREQADAIVATYPAHEREARAYGKPVLGSGAIFPIEESSIVVPPFSIPDHWPRIVGIDLGWDHPTAAAWLAHDQDTDTVYLYDVYKAEKQVPAVHASAIKSRGSWIPVAWPHDALQAQKDTGIPMRDTYIAEGLNMLPERAQFEDGSNGVEPGLQIMLNRMTKGQLKVVKSCEGWLEEYRIYHRVNGVVQKRFDDAISASRYGIMDLRHARTNTTTKLKIFRDR